MRPTPYCGHEADYEPESRFSTISIIVFDLLSTNFSLLTARDRKYIDIIASRLPHIDFIACHLPLAHSWMKLNHSSWFHPLVQDREITKEPAIFFRGC